MKNTDKIILIGFFSAFVVLVGLFLFSHFQQNLTPSFGITHAQDLHTDLVNGKSSQTWIFDVWKVALALANVIVIVMLLFVAVVNIVHLQYDTYAIKKSLPLLIIGIIMANFSLLICRMIVDAAQVLTNTFAGDPAGLAHDLLCGMGFLTSQTGTNLTVTATIVTLLTGGVGGVGALIAGGLIIVVIILLVVLIAVLILSFLLWIRKFVIFLLVAVAPVAFILYAFPPTQGLFKQWWSWFLKWTFMGPIVMLLIWVASQIGSGNCTVTSAGTNNFNISALFAECGVLYLAAIVPFKLGGGVMSAWGKAGQWATGTNKGGYLRKPVDESIQRKKDIAKGAATTAFGNTRFGAWSDRGKKNEEGLIANYKNRRDTQLTNREHEVRTRHADFAENEKALERAKGRLETTIKSQIGIYTQQHAGAIGNEKLASINAEGSVKKADADAETAARTEAGELQRLKEREVTYSETELEGQKSTMDAKINQGRLDNITQDELQKALGQNPDEGSHGQWSGLAVKDRYQEQDKRISDTKEELAKRLGQDMTKLSQKKLNDNVQLRETQKELLDAGVGVVTNRDSQNKIMANGETRFIHQAEATETAEQLRFIGDEDGANYFDSKAQEYKDKYQTYTPAMVTALENRATTLDTEATHLETAVEPHRQALEAQKVLVAEANTSHAAKQAAIEVKQVAIAREKNATAKTQLEAEKVALETDLGQIDSDRQTRETRRVTLETTYRTAADTHRKAQVKAENTRTAAAIVHDRAAQNVTVNYDAYLSNNVAGRQQKNINPDFSEEVKVQRMSGSPGQLLSDAIEGKFGTGENRSEPDKTDPATGAVTYGSMSKLVRGESHELNEPQTKAAIVQFDAIWENAQTARMGDQAGLDSLDGINKIMRQAGRVDFPTAASKAVIKSMPIDARNQFKMGLARMKSGLTAKQWSELPPSEREARGEAVDINDAVSDEKFFSSLVTEGAGEPAKTNKEFIKRYLRQVEEDPGLTIGSSYGTRATRPRAVNKNNFIENQNI